MRLMPRPSRSMNSRWLAVIALLAAARVTAQEPPTDPTTPPPAVELGIGFRGVTSANGFTTYAVPPSLASPAGAPSQVSGILDFSDTYLYVRPRLALYRPGLRIGGMFALTFPDAYFEPGTIFLAEGSLFLESRWFTIRAGRTRVKTAIVPFPTLRDDDLIRFSDAQNPFSDGRSTADHQYGNTVDATVWIRPRWFVDAHAENMPNFALRPESIVNYEFNSFGFDLGYQQTAPLTRISVLRTLGAGVNLYHVDDNGRSFAVEALGGAWLNLIVDPIHNLDWRAQIIYNDGVPRAQIATLTDSFRARQISAVTSFGYSYRRRLLPTVRAAVIGAYKRYLDVNIDQFSIVGNAFYALGLGVEAGLQYEYRSRAADIPIAFGDNQEHSLKLALIARFDVLFNRQFDERDSLLNTQSGYLP